MTICRTVAREFAQAETGGGTASPKPAATPAEILARVGELRTYVTPEDDFGGRIRNGVHHSTSHMPDNNGVHLVTTKSGGTYNSKVVFYTGGIGYIIARAEGSSIKDAERIAKGQALELYPTDVGH